MTRKRHGCSLILVAGTSLTLMLQTAHIAVAPVPHGVVIPPWRVPKSSALKTRFAARENIIQQTTTWSSWSSSPSSSSSSSPCLEDKLAKSNALFTLMLSRGNPFFDSLGNEAVNNNHTVQNIDTASTRVVDIISIGTQSALPLLEAQSLTWASHSSVRYFFGVTEADDADPTCFIKLGPHMMNISQECQGRVKKRYNHSSLMTYQINSFAHDKHLQQKGPGWMCNFRRSSHAWGKLGRFYRTLIQLHQSLRGGSAEAAASAVLPDYVLIIDDDTYYNMELFHQDVFRHNDPSIPIAEAGCLVQSPIHIVNFSFPFGGFGVTTSRGAIQNMIQPVDCSVRQDDNFSNHVCRQLQDNVIGELPSFRDGMSLSDLMDAHAARDPFSNFTHWKHARFPWCLHSDWVTGVYDNYYRATSHVSHAAYRNPKRGRYFEDNPHFRIGSRLGILYKKARANPPRNCVNGAGDGDRTCDAKQQLCHRQTPDTMKEFTMIVQQQQMASSSPYFYRKNQNLVIPWRNVVLDGLSFIVSTKHVA